MSQQIYNKRPNSQSWFSPRCGVAIAHFRTYTNFITVECSRTIAVFITACNHSERCLENAKSSKVQLIQAKDLVPVRFWKIANMILIEANRQFINDPEVILLSSIRQ